MGHRVILLTSLLLAAGICDAGATSITLDPAAQGTLITGGDGQIYIRSSGFCGAPDTLQCEFVMSDLWVTEMRVITEFDLSGQTSASGRMYLEAYMMQWEPQDAFGHITLDAYSGNGTLDTSDYYRTDFPLLTFYGPSRANEWVAFSIDITDAYNTFIQNGDPYLGFVLSRTEPEPPRFAVAGLMLSKTPLPPWSAPPEHVADANSPPQSVADAGSTLLLFGLALTGLAGVRHRCRR